MISVGRLGQGGEEPRVLSPDPTAFFDTVAACFEQAEKLAGGPDIRQLEAGDSQVRLRFAGSSLISPLMPALAHLQVVPQETPDLTICIWDSASSGVSWPDMPWFQFPALVDSKGAAIENPYTPRGDIRGYSDSRIQMHVGDRIFSLLDQERNLGIYWCEESRHLPIYERGAPLRSIFHWWFRDRGLQLIHAGAVGTASGAVLLAGKGGSGKSTTAISCIDSNLLYLSDDYSLVSAGPEPIVYSLYNTAKLSAADVHHFGRIHGALANSHRLQEEKALFFLHPSFSHKLARSLPIRAILLPRVASGQRTTFTPCDSGDALSTLALSSLHQLTGSGKELLQTVRRLTASVPAYHLDLGADRAQISGAISQFLAGIQPADSG